MSVPQHEDEEFKLPLRPWLRKHIDKKTFEGLEWVDIEKQIFKVPWTKKNHPGWERHYEVFVSWAKHRGRLGSGPIDYNKLKGNFRSVIHKSEDIKELKDRRISDHQTGNYRVFQILPSSVVKENRKRSRCKLEGATSHAISKLKRSSEDSPPAQEQYQLPLDQVTTREAPVHNPQSTSVSQDFFLSTEINSIPVVSCPVNISPSMPLSPMSSFAPTITDQTLPTILYQDVQQLLPDYDSETAAFVAITDGVAVPQNEQNQTVAGSILQEQADQESLIKLHHILETYNIEKHQLTQFMLTVYYGHEIVVCQKHFDLLPGLRILYGDSVSQSNAVSANGKIVNDFTVPAFELPEIKSNILQLEETLKLAQPGIVFHCTPDGTLTAKRLCQSKVYFKKGEALTLKLERKAFVQVFSYVEYTKSLQNNVDAFCDWKLELFLGKEPPAPIFHTVKIEIQPFLLPHIEHFFTKENNSSSSLFFSTEPSSVDKMITLFSNQSLI